jgi:hypothetical protein
MGGSTALTRAEDITRAILVLPGHKVLLDRELAVLCGVTTTSRFGATAVRRTSI